MRRPFLPVLIVIIISAVGIFFALTYKIPEVQVFQLYQNLDQEIVTCEKQNTSTLEENLNALQASVSGLISAGQTYDGSADLTELFDSFNTQYKMLKQYNESVATCISSAIEKTNFDEIEKVIKKLPADLQTLGSEMTSLQQERTTKLTTLEGQISSLVDTLSNFEEMFYNTKTSEAVQYFQSVNTAFSEVQTLHTEYMTTVESYYVAKTAYYESIANKGTLDYLFKK